MTICKIHNIKKSLIFLKKISKTLYNSREFDYNVQAIWVWRSLVARMNGVHEAGSSSLLTQTKTRLSTGFFAPNENFAGAQFCAIVAPLANLFKNIL